MSTPLCRQNLVYLDYQQLCVREKALVRPGSHVANKKSWAETAPASFHFISFFICLYDPRWSEQEFWYAGWFCSMEPLLLFDVDVRHLCYIRVLENLSNCRSRGWISTFSLSLSHQTVFTSMRFYCSTHLCGYPCLQESCYHIRSEWDLPMNASLWTQIQIQQKGHVICSQKVSFPLVCFDIIPDTHLWYRPTSKMLPEPTCRSLLRMRPMAGKEPSACWCLMSQDLAAWSSSGSMKMKPRDWAKDFNTNAVSLETAFTARDT